MNRAILLLLTLWTTAAFGQSGKQGPAVGTTPAPQGKDIPGMLLARVEQKLNWGENNLQEGDYQSSANNSRQALEDLEILKTLLMPLDARIKKVRDQEKNILERTESIQNNPSKKEEGSLHQDQIENRDETKLAVQQAAAYKQNLGKQPTVKSPQPGQTQKQQNALEKVERLLTEAEKDQETAAGKIKSKEFDAAATHEKNAIAKLEKALKTLQRSNGKQKQKNSNNRDQDKQGKKKDDKKGKQNQTGKNNAKNQDGKNDEKAKKFSRKDALRELAKLRKKAGKRRKDRELRYGKARIQKREVEKDW